ncbi:MAG: oligosaccharide flippase family protein [Bacteroidetes bacterium]|nr:oligosaccharide flippase family protein [Bacteroidota bacterium]
MFRFSSHLLGARLVETLVSTVYSIIIGKYFNTRDLGFYTNSKQYPEYLSFATGGVLMSVTFPVLASLKNERETMVLVYGRLLRVTALCNADINAVRTFI